VYHLPGTITTPVCNRKTAVHWSSGQVETAVVARRKGMKTTETGSGKRFAAGGDGIAGFGDCAFVDKAMLP
jgi:hypothetical protein